MDPVGTEVSAGSLPFARSYQLEALEMAMKQNTIVYLETGSGKTLIAIMLLRSYAYHIRKPSRYFAVFLVPTVVLVSQQAAAIKLHTDLKVGMYWGDMGVDYWDGAEWNREIDENEVLVMTPAILLNGLRHGFFKMDMIKVLIFDECHNARGNHAYACTMKEFYHPQLKSENFDVPRVLGMTASLVKSKVPNSSTAYWKRIHELETLMHAKVYTCASESVLAGYVPFSTPKFKFYQDVEAPYPMYLSLLEKLSFLKVKHMQSVECLGLSKSAAESIKKRVSKMHTSLGYCLAELGVWLALKAAESFRCKQSDFSSWGQLDVTGEKIVKDFSGEVSQAFGAYIPCGYEWPVVNNIKSSVDAGLLTSKSLCLIESLLEYSNLTDIRCIVFVERIITAIVMESLLANFFSKFNGWKTKYLAGNNSGLQCQTRKLQNQIVEEFREGSVNIIVATSILEEGLDVPCCNLVIRFDPSTNVCSFIQSQGRARMQNSTYLMIVKRGDSSTCSRLENYISSNKVMRRESLRNASVPCLPLEGDDEDCYRVASTGAVVNLTSSISLLHFYCSRLPSDRYYKPAPSFHIDEDGGICFLDLPKSSPIKSIRVQGNIKNLRQAACLEACKQLHKAKALTDNLVPDIVVEEASVQESGNYLFMDVQPIYSPPELVGLPVVVPKTTYYLYLIKLQLKFYNDIPVHDILLGTRCKIEGDNENMDFDLEVDGGLMNVGLRYLRKNRFTEEQVSLCRRFQITIFRVLMGCSLDKLSEILNRQQIESGNRYDYLLIPADPKSENFSIDWEVLGSVNNNTCRHDHVNCSVKSSSHVLHTNTGPVCACIIRNSLVFTPHTGRIYCVNDIMEGLNANSLLRFRDGNPKTYKEYYLQRYGIGLAFVDEPLVSARHIFTVQNHVQRCRKRKEKEPSKAFVELPPELCRIVMAPITSSTIYSYAFLPIIMHRLECLLVASNLTKAVFDHCNQAVVIPTIKVLEAITTKNCRERFHLESLETLGDSFLKYTASQYLFTMHQNHHEGLLNAKRQKIVSNAVLCRLGWEQKLPGFIRDECFDPKTWKIPGESSDLTEEPISNTRKMYIKGTRRIGKRKKVADVVEALIGVYLSEEGESAALMVMNWLGIKADIVAIPYATEFTVCAEKLVNIRYIESLLNYSFRDPSLLVEALAHGSYMRSEIPRCYQRLEFLGDAVLDYLTTRYLYEKYPGMTPGLLTDMRSASVNNDCYALSAYKAGLHKHILHLSHVLHQNIERTIHSFKKLSSDQKFGWETETSFPKVLADVIESLAGAILVDSGYDKDIVFASIRPLLEPLVTPETLKLQPARELTNLCQRQQYDLKKPVVSRENSMTHVTIEVDANGVVFKNTASAGNKKMAKKLACKRTLESLKSV